MAADLADALAYQLFDRLEPISTAAEVVTGYHSVLALEEAELSLLLDLVATRLPISGITCGWRSSEHPENRDYILGHDPYTGRTLETLIDVDHGSALTVFREAWGLGPGRGGRSNAVGIRRRIYGSAVRASWHPV